MRRVVTRGRGVGCRLACFVGWGVVGVFARMLNASGLCTTGHLLCTPALLPEHHQNAPSINRFTVQTLNHQILVIRLRYRVMVHSPPCSSLIMNARSLSASPRWLTPRARSARGVYLRMMCVSRDAIWVDNSVMCVGVHLRKR